MKFKLDENFGTRTQTIFKNSGHDVETVLDENLGGASDEALIAHCKNEKRCLITLDLDFSDVIRFPPKEASGIVVIRVQRNPSVQMLETLIKKFLEALKSNTQPLDGSLWIVEIERIRVYTPDSGE